MSKSEITKYLASIGAQGGKARAAGMTKARRSEIAKLAADAKWQIARKAGNASGKARKAV